MTCWMCHKAHIEGECKRALCSCGSNITLVARDKLDGALVRRCFRCLAVKVWKR